MTNFTVYESWRQSYSNEDIDRIASLALRMTDADREAGRRPKFSGGYSQENWDKAYIIVKSAQK